MCYYFTNFLKLLLLHMSQEESNQFLFLECSSNDYLNIEAISPMASGIYEQQKSDVDKMNEKEYNNKISELNFSKEEAISIYLNEEHDNNNLFEKKNQNFLSQNSLKEFKEHLFSDILTGK